MNYKNLSDTKIIKRYLLASDFDKTLSYDDTGVELSKLLNIKNFKRKSGRISRTEFHSRGCGTYLFA